MRTSPAPTTSARVVIGAHAPVAGGLAKAALPYLDATGADVVQIFVSNPRGWTLSEGDPAQDEAFVRGLAQRGAPAFIHTCLLVNLGSPTRATVEHSRATLEHGLRRGAAIGAKGVVFHAGSAVDESHVSGALRQVRRQLLPLLDAAAESGAPKLLVEPSAGGGRSLAARVEDLADYLDAVGGHPWLGVCFDTCHAWAAGHDVATPGGMSATLDTLVAIGGPGRLALVHANDSRDPCGSLRDRHENIGVGALGEAAFAELLAHPAMAEVPVVVETPSTGTAAQPRSGEGRAASSAAAPRNTAGHAADIATLRRLASTANGGPHRRRRTRTVAP